MPVYDLQPEKNLLIDYQMYEESMMVSISGGILLILCVFGGCFT